jgi:uncharacterized membrane protein YqjE
MSTETVVKTVYAESPLSQLPSLFKKFVDQFLRLFDIQLALFKSEVKEAVKICTRQLILTAVSAIVASAGFAFLSIGLVFWVNSTINNLAISFGSVGSAYLIIGSISALALVKRMMNQPAAFNQTLEELERNQQWIKSETQQVR